MRVKCDLMAAGYLYQESAGNRVTSNFKEDAGHALARWPDHVDFAFDVSQVAIILKSAELIWSTFAREIIY